MAVAQARESFEASSRLDGEPKILPGLVSASRLFHGSNTKYMRLTIIAQSYCNIVSEIKYTNSPLINFRRLININRSLPHYRSLNLFLSGKPKIKIFHIELLFNLLRLTVHPSVT